MSTSPVTRSAVVDALVTRGHEIAADESNTVLNEFGEAVAAFMAKAADDKINPAVVVNATGALKALTASPDNAFTLPASGSTSRGLNPKLERLVRAYDRGEIELDDTTGLPKAPDEGAEVDNALTALERELKTGRVTTDDNPTRLRRIVDSVKGLREIATDKVGEIADALGLAKDAKPDDIVAAAKASKDKTDALSSIAAELGLPKDAKTSDIVAAVKVAKAGVPAKTTSRLRMPGRS